MTSPDPVLRCPTCRGAVGKDVRYRPFCSERCRRVDLGAWLLGHYRIPAVEDDDTGVDARPTPEPEDDDEPNG